MNHLAADPALRERMGAAARSKIEMYTWDRMAEQTLAVYQEAIAEIDRGDRAGGTR